MVTWSMINTSTKNRAISEDTASVMNRLLRQVIIGSSGTGYRCQHGRYGGYRQDRYVSGLLRSDLCREMTPYYIGGFWTGYDTPAVLPESQLYAPDAVWKTIMSEVHEGLEAKQFELSDEVVAMEFCVESGLAVTSRCTETENRAIIRRVRFPDHAICRMKGMMKRAAAQQRKADQVRWMLRL